MFSTKQIFASISLLLFFKLSMANSFPNCQTPDNSNLFTASICIDDKFKHYGGNSAEDLIDQFDEAQLKKDFKGYDENNSIGLFKLDFRGIPMEISFPKQGESKLVFKVGSLKIEKIFEGNTRDESKEQLKDYLKNDGDRIMKELTKKSPVDPIAGNPASTEASMAEGEFNAGTQGNYSINSFLGVGARFGRFSQGGRNITSYTLPLSYTHELNNGHEISFRLPITYIEVEGAESYSIVFGGSYKFPVMKKNGKSKFPKEWFLTPSLSYGLVGSKDLGGAAQMLSASLTSDALIFTNSKFSIRMANMVGYYQTLPVAIQDYNIDIDLKNTIYRNGFSISMPLQKYIGDYTLNTFITDTRFLGDELFIEQYNEIGFSIEKQKSSCKNKSFATKFVCERLGIGITYLHAENNAHSLKLMLKYQF